MIIKAWDKNSKLFNTPFIWKIQNTYGLFWNLLSEDEIKILRKILQYSGGKI